MQIRGSQIKDLSIGNLQIAAGAAIELTKLAEAVIQADGGQAFTANQDMGGFKLTGVADPTLAQDAATKAYVDAVATGLNIKNSVRAATTTPGALATAYENGDTIDGVVLVTGDRILIKDQSVASENGIYVVQATGAPIRATDADTDAEVTAGMFTFIEEGTTLADTGWVLSTDNPITVNTTGLTFTQFSTAGVTQAGNGLVQVGTDFNVVAADNSLTINANDMQVKVDPARAITTTASGIGSNVDNSTIEISGNALQVKLNGINDTHIDFGTGANQVSAADIPILDAGAFLTATDVEGALQELMAEVDANSAHATSDGSSHTFIDQDVTIGSSPTFNGVNITGLVAGAVDSVHFATRKASVGTIPKDTPVYITGWDGVNNVVLVEAADAASAATMPAVGIAETAITNAADAFVTASGTLSGVNTSAFSPGDDLYIASGGGLTTTKPVGTNLIQKMAEVVEAAVSGSLVLFGAGRTNDLPNIPQNNIWLGNASGVPTATPLTSLAGLGLESSGGTLAVNVDDVTVEVVTDNVQIKDLGVSTAKIANDAVDKTKIAADVAGKGIAQAVGGELDVDEVEEVPVGTVDGVNTTFTLTAAPANAIVNWYINGIRQKVTTDYSLAGAVITCVSSVHQTPQTGDDVYVTYLK